jgi:hypothetical protein
MGSAQIMSTCPRGPPSTRIPFGYELNRREWNALTFFDYHRYGTKSTLRFNEIPN